MDWLIDVAKLAVLENDCKSRFVLGAGESTRSLSLIVLSIDKAGFQCGWGMLHMLHVAHVVCGGMLHVALFAVVGTPTGVHVWISAKIIYKMWFCFFFLCCIIVVSIVVVVVVIVVGAAPAQHLWWAWQVHFSINH